MVSDGNLVTIAGGKWTTYRQMAEDTVDRVIATCGLETKKGCQTNGFMLDGGNGYYDLLFVRLCQDFGLEVEVCSMWTSVFK
jgi:glycerol-3-phosphate dehydrogenase